MKPRILLNEELAWAAGFFDGEGCIYVARMNKQSNAPRNIHFDIAQIHPFVLHRFKKAVGVGKIYGPYLSKAKNRKPYWRYTLSGFEQCQFAIAALWNFLSPIKRKQATKALKGYLNDRKA